MNLDSDSKVIKGPFFITKEGIMLGSIITLITGGMKVAEQVLIKSNTKESRKYLEEWKVAEKEALEAERMVELEKAKPQAEQYDSVVEHFESKAEHLHKMALVLEKVAEQELQRMLATPGA